jgi:hypothetical protein
MSYGFDLAFFKRWDTYIERLCRVPEGKPRDIRERHYLAALKRHDRTGCLHTMCGLLPPKG